MKPEVQRIAIAEWCGWRIIRTEESRGRFVTLVPPKGTECPDWPMFEEGDGWKGYIPDYLNDLNAMHEAESHLKDKAQQDAYFLSLAKVSSSVELNYWTHMNVVAWLAMRATAAQRAEALLQTIGKWTDSTLHTKG